MPVMRHLPLVLVIATAGCGLNGVTMYPYVAGLIWTAAEEVTTNVTTYRRSGDAEPVVAATVLGFGENCANAQAITGGAIFNGTFRREWTNEVVGNTSAHHPLKPGKDGFNGIGVSVVAEQIVETGAASTSVSTTFEDEDGDLQTVEEFVSGPEGVSTGSRYHGVAADEYIVSLFPFNMWSTWEDDDDFGAYDDAEGEEFDGPGDDQFFTLLSKRAPGPGDIWTSTNGNSVFRFSGREKRNVGGNTFNANRIDVFTLGNFDPTAGNVLTSCLLTSAIEYASTDPDVDGVLTDLMFLDPGCEGRFVHQQIGTEWWANNALVEFQGTRVWVEVSDFGWEWYEDEDAFCIRVTDSIRPTDRPAAVPFIEYSVEVEVSNFVVDSWQDKPEKSDAE